MQLGATVRDATMARACEGSCGRLGPLEGGVAPNTTNRLSAARRVALSNRYVHSGERDSWLSLAQQWASGRRNNGGAVIVASAKPAQHDQGGSSITVHSRPLQPEWQPGW
jgi:hypothetical protein